jgi:hypothetical protein
MSFDIPERITAREYLFLDGVGYLGNTVHDQDVGNHLSRVRAPNN